MKPRKFTIVTQLHKNQNEELITYLDFCFTTYNCAKRETFHHIKRTPHFNKSKFNTYLQHKYNILKRTANSIISNAQGDLNALIELKQYEKKQLIYKIEALTQDIEDIQLKVECNKQRLRLNDRSVCLVKHRNMKRKLVAKKNRLNRYNQKLNNLTYQLDNRIYKLCFGTKHLLQHNYSKFVKQRDSQVAYVGSKDETAGNQLLQLTYNSKNNQFTIKLRKDFGGFKKESNAYCYGKIHLNYCKKEIISILRNGGSPLSYKIIRKNNRYYLYCTFEIKRDISDFLTRSTNGMIGLDFNKGFVTLTETNSFGHMIDTQVLNYRFKQGNSTQSDLENIVRIVCKRALQSGKDVAIENLNFVKKKSKTISKKGKKYNDMLHTLAYSKFTDIMERCCYRNRVWLHKVNPAWTSWIAKRKYCPIMKLNTHVGASFVIARRGQGYKD